VETLVYYLPALACAGGMALCMFMMARGHSKADRQGGGAGTPAPGSDDEVVRLGAEVDALRAELEARNTTGAAAS
jgi:hypothetical protein